MTDKVESAGDCTQADLPEASAQLLRAQLETMIGAVRSAVQTWKCRDVVYPLAPTRAADELARGMASIESFADDIEATLRLFRPPAGRRTTHMGIRLPDAPEAG